MNQTAPSAPTREAARVQMLTFPRELWAASPARQFVADAAGSHPAAAHAVMLAGELVANSLLHAADATAVTVAVTITPAVIRIDVFDNGSRGIPHLRDASPDAEDGRGLHMVNDLASQWGFTRVHGLTRCWAETDTGITP